MSHEGWQSYWQKTDIPLGFMYDQGGLREVKETAPVAENFVEVPLALPGGAAIGNLVISDDPQRPLTEEDRDFVQQVSEQVALALESARLFEQTQSALASTQDSQTKLSEALNTAKEALDIAKLAHWEFNLEKDKFIFNDQFYSLFRTTAEKVGGYELAGEQYAQLFVHPEDAYLVGQEIAKGLASTDPHFSANLEHRIIFADGTQGYMSVEVHIERDENGKITRWYGANQDITERRMAQELIAKRARDLAAVSDISSASTKELDIEKLLETVVHLTQRKFELYHAHVFTFNELSNALEIRACGWKEGDEHEGTHGTTIISLTQEQSLVARAARTRQPVIVNDVHNEPGWLPNPLLPDTQAEMAVPMIIGDQLLGVLDVQSDKLNAFSQEDASIQTTLASQIATALQNARSFEQAQRQAERESRLNIISQKIQSATTVEAVLQIAARELGHTLGAPLTIAQLGLKDKSNGN
jgi:GAF domain-containing protein